MEGNRCIYVGRTRNTKTRFAIHKKTTLRKRYCCRMDILEETDLENASTRETFWIHYFAKKRQAEINIRQRHGKPAPQRKKSIRRRDAKWAEIVSFVLATRQISAKQLGKEYGVSEQSILLWKDGLKTHNFKRNYMTEEAKSLGFPPF